MNLNHPGAVAAGLGLCPGSLGPRQAAEPRREARGQRLRGRCRTHVSTVLPTAATQDRRCSMMWTEAG